MKRAVSLIVGLIVMLIMSEKAFALDLMTDDTAEITQQIYHDSGADELIFALPESALEPLTDIGFEGFMPNGTDSVTAPRVVKGIRGVISEQIGQPLEVLTTLLGIIILSAALNAIQNGGAANAALSVVSSLAAISVIAPPILSLTKELSDTIEASSSFMLLYIPVISGLMIASGKAAGGSAYCAVMVYAANAVLQISSKLVVPLLKCVMSLSVVSSSCEKVRLDGVIELLRRMARTLLTFCMSLFVAFLTMKSIVTAAADSLGNRAVKFAVSSFVPIVGGALSDAYQTMISCVSVLKSGVGAAAIVAVFVIFLPAAVNCALWQAVTSVGAAVCDMFEVGRVSALLRSLSNVVSIMLAMLLCTMVLYIISTAIIIIVGG